MGSRWAPLIDANGVVPRFGQLSYQIKEVPPFDFHHKYCSIFSLFSNICFQIWEPPFQLSRVGFCFLLLYLFHKKMDHKLLCILNLHHNFAYISCETSNIDLNPSPSSCWPMFTPFWFFVTPNEFSKNSMNLLDYTTRRSYSR